MSTKKLSYDIGIGFNVDSSQLNNLRQSLSALEKDLGLSQLQIINPQSVEQAKADLQEIRSAAKIAGDAIEASFNPKLNTINVQTFQNHLKQSNVTIQMLGNSLAKAGIQGEQAFRNMSVQILNTGFQLKKTSSLVQSMANTLGNTIKWSIASTALNTVTGKIQEAWGYTKKLDASLNDIRIVTGKSAESMEKFAKQANRAAKSLGAATTDYTNASLIFYQQGLGETDVQARTEATIKAANVTGQSAAEVSEQLTAVWNGYKVVAEEAETYVDKLAAVAAATAADLEELSDGMSKVASAASTMGVNIDQLSAQLSTIVSVTRQDASLVGTALKTIYARMGDLKVDGVDEFGTSLGDVSGQMRQMGIEVLDQEGNLKDMGGIIEEVAEKWGDWTDAQRQAAAVAIAGKRQYNNLIALFENWDMYESALTTSQTGAGTLQKQQDTYMDSLEAHLNQLSVAGERVYDAFFDSDSMKDFIDGITVAVEGVANLIEAIGGGGNLLLMLGSTAIRVFSVQLTGAISGFIANIQASKFNVQQLEAQIAMEQQLRNTEMPKTEKHYQTLLDMKKEELKYHKLISAEQRAQIDGMIEAQNQNFTDKENQQQQFKTSKQTLESLTGEKLTVVGTGNHLAENQELETAYQSQKNAQSRAAAATQAVEDKGPDFDFERYKLSLEHNQLTEEVSKKGILQNKNRLAEVKKEKNEIDTIVSEEQNARQTAEDLGVLTEPEYQSKQAGYLRKVKSVEKTIQKKKRTGEDYTADEQELEQLKTESNQISTAFSTYQSAKKRRTDAGLDDDAEVSRRRSALDEEEKILTEAVSKKGIKKNKKRLAENEAETQENEAIVTEEKNAKISEKVTQQIYEQQKQEAEKNGQTVITEEEFLQRFLAALEKSRNSEITVDQGIQEGDALDIYRANADQVAQDFSAATGGQDISTVDPSTITGPEQLEMLRQYQEILGNIDGVYQSQKRSIEELTSLTSENNRTLLESNKTDLANLKSEKQYELVLNKVAKGVKLNSTEEKTLQQYLKKAQKIVQKNTKEIEAHAEAHRKNAEAAKRTATEEKKVEEAFNAQKKSLNTQAMVKGALDMVGAIGQLGSALSSLKNLGNIWSDETLSGGDKFLQTLTTLGMAIPMLLASLKGLAGGFATVAGALAAENSALGLSMSLITAKDSATKVAILTKMAEQGLIDKSTISENANSAAILANIALTKIHEASTKGNIIAKIADAAANWALQASMSPVLVITLLLVAAMIALVIAIAAVVAIVKGLTAIFEANGDNGKKAFEAARKEAEAAREEFNRVKAAYEELQASFDEYNNAQKAIEELTVGTEEWKQAIQDANMQVIDLMNKYPELAQYVDNVDGQLKISAEGQEQMLEKERQKVETANRAQMAAQINMLDKQNDMTARQGANKSFDTTAQKDWATGVGITSGVAAIIGGPVGWAIAGVGAAVTGALAVNAKAQEEAYLDALDLIAEDETILESEEAFKKAMEEAGWGNMADALWENRDELAKNSAAIDANRAAMKIQEEQIARSRLSELEKFDEIESEDQDTLTKIVAKETRTESQAYKDAMSKLGGSDIDKDEGADIADKYADLMGIDAVETEYDKDTGVITYIDSKGEEVKVNAKTAQTALAQEMAGASVNDDYINKKLEQLQEIEKTADEAGKSFGKLLTKFAAGEEADLTSGTNTQIDELKGAIDAYDEAFNSVEVEKNKNGAQTNLAEQMEAGGQAFANALGYANEAELEEAAKEMGFESIDEYKKAIEKSIENYEKEERKLTIGLNANVAEAFNGLNLDEYSLEAKKKIADSLTAAFEKGGKAGSDALASIIETGSFNEHEIGKIADAMSEIDWTSSGSINELEKKLEETGIQVDKSSEYWNELTSAMEASQNVVLKVLNNLNDLRGTLASISEITNDLHLGSIISDEDYETLVANNAALKDYFVMTADGYKYLGGAEAEIEKAKNNVLNVDDIKEQFDATKEDVEALMGNSDVFKKDAKTGRVSMKAGKSDAFANLLNSGSYDDVIAAAGYNADTYKASQNELTQKGISNVDLRASAADNLTLQDIAGAKNVDDLVTKLGYDSVQAYADAHFAGDFNLAREALSNAMSDAKTRVTDAEKYIQNTQSSVMNTLNQVESGDWEKQSRNAQTAAVAGLAKNYNELTQYKEKLNDEDYNKLAVTYLAEEAEALGVNATAWEAYVKTVGDNVEAQDETLKIFQQLKLYEQADAYHYLNKAVEDVTSTIDELSDAQSRLYGLDVVENIKEQIEAYEDLYQKQQKVFEKQKSQEELSKSALNLNNAALNEQGVANLEYNTDGTVKESSYDEIYAAALAASESGDETTYNFLVGVLDSITAHNDKVYDRIQSEEDALAEKNNNILDAQIEAYNQEMEMTKEFRDTVKEWKKSLQEFKRFSNNGAAAFDELSASDVITNVIDSLSNIGAIPKEGESFVVPESFSRVAELESWKDGGGTDNPFIYNGVFDEAAYQEAYATAMEDSQADMEEMIDLGQELFDSWLSGLEEISAMYDEQVDKLSSINSLLETSAELTKLFSDRTAGYANKVLAYYTLMRQNAEATTALYKGQVEFLQDQYNDFFNEDGTLKAGVSEDQAKAVWDAYVTAKQNYLDAMNAQAEAIQAEFENGMQAIVDEAFAGVFNNLGIDKVSEVWEMKKSQESMYLDAVNEEYERYKLERTMQKAIDETDSITAQNKLMEKRVAIEEELTKVKEKQGKLSQYDIDRANAMYDLTLKQIALEEAQQTANKMKLTRDASGNYSYQYVQDTDKIAEMEEQMKEAENNLYNLEKDRQEELIDNYLNYWQEYRDKVVEYANDPAMLAEIEEAYNGENGFLTQTKLAMESLGTNLDAISGILGQNITTPWMETFNKLGDVDTESILSSTATLVESTTSSLSTLGEAYAQYQETEEGIIDRLGGYISTADELAPKVDTLADKMTEAASAIDTVVANISTLVTNLETYAQNYQNYLKSNISEDNAGDKSAAEAAGKENDKGSKEVADAVYEIGSDICSAIVDNTNAATTSNYVYSGSPNLSPMTLSENPFTANSFATVGSQVTGMPTSSGIRTTGISPKVIVPRF